MFAHQLFTSVKEGAPSVDWTGKYAAGKSTLHRVLVSKQSFLALILTENKEIVEVEKSKFGQ